MTDFGLAVAVEHSAASAYEQFQGRIAYSAPEYVLKSRCDARIDLFSLGVVFYEALTGRRPFGATDPVSYVRQVRGRIRPAIAQIRYEFYTPSGPPPGLVQFASIIDRLLEPEPGDRFQSAIEVVDALDQIDVPVSTRRDLEIAVQENQPDMRKSIRLNSGGKRSGTFASVRSHAPAGGGVRRPSLMKIGYDPELDGLRVTPSGAEATLLPPPSARHLVAEWRGATVAPDYLRRSPRSTTPSRMSRAAAPRADGDDLRPTGEHCSAVQRCGTERKYCCPNRAASDSPFCR